MEIIAIKQLEKDNAALTLQLRQQKAEHSKIEAILTQQV